MRYLLFAGDNYYPAGGWFDARGVFNNVSEAHAYFRGTDFQWGHVVDLSIGEITHCYKADRYVEPPIFTIAPPNMETKPPNFIPGTYGRRDTLQSGHESIGLLPA
jgi:hypothetical protein